ncbi:MAG: hypothetical protein R2720_00155 [Candidatus Nanopelagicales bacterium]
MGTFPGTPRTLRGAIVAVDPLSPLSRIVVFQYNPDNVIRTLTPHDTQGSSHRISGAPTEQITMTVELDATDGLAAADPLATTTGVAGQLAALEMLLYPSSLQVVANTALLLAGTIEILPPDAPLTVLAWGPGRTVPVRLTGLRITEQAFDTALNPIRAAAEVSAEVLSYNDLPPTDAGYALFLAHQVTKEVLATTASVSGALSAAAGGSL